MARSFAATMASVVLLAILAGCASTAPGGSAGGGSGSRTTPSRQAATEGGSAAGDPRAIRGPSTAATVTEVKPIVRRAKPKLPVTVTDATRTSVTVTDASRILALDVHGALAETVVGLGLGDRLVGRGVTNTLASMRDLPLVTSNGHVLNGEAILSIRPTVLLTDTTVGPREVQDQLRASGIAVVFFNPDRTLDSVARDIKTVAHALGMDAGGTRLAKRVNSDFAKAKTTIRALSSGAGDQPLKIAFLYVRGRAGIFFVLGKGSGADGLITSIGGRDAASEAGVKGTRPATSEALVAMDPDVILVMTDGLESTGGVSGLLERPGVGETTAGRNQRIVDMADGQILSFGPTSPAVTLSLAHAVYAPDSAD